MENESKKKIKNKVILYTVGEVLTANLVKDVVLGIKDSSIRGKSDASHENSVGYENINTRFNTKVHVNNFVVLHIKRKEYNDITALTNKLNKCKNEGISVSLVFECDADTLGEMYMDTDYLESILKRFDIDMPIYFDIDKIMSNKKLNNTMKKLLYIIIPIGILAILNILTDEQYIIVGWIFIGIWIIKILAEK